MSTLTIPPVIPTPREDAAKLYKAFKGLGCNTSKVIKILAHRNAEQRSFIQQEFETTYSEFLSKRISTELRGHVKKAVMLWLHDPPTRDATVIRQALTSSLVDNQAITEVICSRSPSQLRQMKEVYLSTYHSELEKDIENQTSGDHKKLLLAYVSTPRYEGPELDDGMVQEDAEQLYKAGEKRLGTNEKMFIKIFSDRSSTHMAAVNNAYIASYGHTLEKAIKKETSGSFQRGLLTILRCATDPALYFAKILRKSMKGVGTDDSRLIRVVVTRTEIDMHHIKVAYYRKYGKPLTHAVRSDTSGHYKDFLIHLIGTHNAFSLPSSLPLPSLSIFIQNFMLKENSLYLWAWILTLEPEQFVQISFLKEFEKISPLSAVVTSIDGGYSFFPILDGNTFPTVYSTYPSSLSHWDFLFHHTTSHSCPPNNNLALRENKLLKHNNKIPSYSQQLQQLKVDTVSWLLLIRPHPNGCSASDLDGDIYFVCWDPELIPSRQIQPMDYTAAPSVEVEHDVMIELSILELDIHK
ncbi:hypothetical protein VNO77_42225 [Canavalia gladiata]|uniref:Multifunctional fusion protein n=1 Tax=Canavalia gladiata TaxID=3824 RepID=A0AAN9K242_CANGL